MYAIRSYYGRASTLLLALSSFWLLLGGTHLSHTSAAAGLHDTARFLFLAGQEAGCVLEEDHRDVVQVAEADKAP